MNLIARGDPLIESVIWQRGSCKSENSANKLQSFTRGQLLTAQHGTSACTSIRRFISELFVLCLQVHVWVSFCSSECVCLLAYNSETGGAVVNKFSGLRRYATGKKFWECGQRGPKNL